MAATITDISSEYEDLQVKIGGGGYVMGIAFADDGTHIIHGDCAGSVLWRDLNGPDPGFQNLARHDLLADPALSATAADWYSDLNVISGGGWGATICKTNSDVMYWGWYGTLWTTKDRGATVHRCEGFTFSNGQANWQVPLKFGENRISCDPANANICYAATLTIEAGAGQIFRTFDGGISTAWTPIPLATIPAPTVTRGQCYTVFDRSSGTVNVGGQNRTARIVIHSPGIGNYLSANGGQTWTSIGGPMVSQSAEFATDGVLYAQADSSSTSAGNWVKCWKYASGTWTDISPPFGGTVECVGVACDPNNAARVLAFRTNSVFYQTLDRGANWQPAANEIAIEAGTGGATWLENVFRGQSHGCAKFHPTEVNKVFITTGVAVLGATIPTTPPGTTTWLQEHNGELENLVGVRVFHPGAQHPVLFCVQDKDIISKFPDEMGEFATHTMLGNVDIVPAHYHPEFNQGSINHGASAASCYHATNEVVGVAAHGVSFDKVSRNGGRDFDWFPAPPFDDTETGGSGQVAINHHNRLNIVRVPTGASSGLPRYTTNGGASWQVCTFTPAVPAGNGFHVAYTSTKNTTQADPNHAGHFYILHSQDPGPGLYGLYESTDGGINFQGVCLTSVLGGGADYWNPYMHLIPGHPGHMWGAGGEGQPLKRSIDYGRTWTAVDGFGPTYQIVLGKPAPGSDYPTLFVAGVVNSQTKGLYRSIDAGVSWGRMFPIANTGELPVMMNAVYCMDGCKTYFGRLYYGLQQGAGYRYMRLKSEPAPTTRVRLS